MSKDLHFDFVPGTTPQYDGDVTLEPLEDDDTEYHNGVGYRQITVEDEPGLTVVFSREFWNGQSRYTAMAANGLSEVVCKVSTDLEPKPNEEDIAKALVAAVRAVITSEG